MHCFHWTSYIEGFVGLSVIVGFVIVQMYSRFVNINRSLFSELTNTKSPVHIDRHIVVSRECNVKVLTLLNSVVC